MAITPEERTARTILPRGEKQRRRHRHNKKLAAIAPDTSDSSSVSSEERFNSNKKSRQRRRNNNNSHNKTRTQSPKRSRNIRKDDRYRNYVALDCEMVGVGPEGIESALARVTIVDWNGIVLLDEFVAPDQKVTDYRTFVSGVTAEDLKNAKWSLGQCRLIVSNMLRGKILVGHGLENDLRALHLSHPWYMVRDTATFAPFMQYRYNGVLCPRKLKHLMKEHLNRDIQVPGRPHSPYEDAFSAMELYKLVSYQWEDALTARLQQLKWMESQRTVAVHRAPLPVH